MAKAVKSKKTQVKLKPREIVEQLVKESNYGLGKLSQLANELANKTTDIEEAKHIAIAARALNRIMIASIFTKRVAILGGRAKSLKYNAKQTEEHNKMMADPKHISCQCGKDGLAEHTCPFKEDVGGDTTTTCNCCKKCTKECKNEI